MKNKTIFFWLICLLIPPLTARGQSVSAGGHSIVACSQWSSQGQVQVWGNNLYGQLGNGSPVSIATLPVYASLLSNVESVSAGWSHSAVVKKDGTLWTWGYNSYGQLGQSSGLLSIPLPTQVTNMSGVRMVACGHEHTLALKQNGTVWACGLNGSGQVGNGGNNPAGSFVQVSGLSNIVQVSSGYTHSMALKSDGTVWAWGGNGSGQLGTGSLINSNTPQQIPFFNDVIFISSGGSHSMAIKSDGSVWVWGKNNFGQLGLGTTANQSTPQQINVINNAIEVAAGWEHSLILKSDSTVWSMGRNNEGQLGIGNYVQSWTPVQVNLPGATKEISAGLFHNMAVGSDNLLRMWGNNFDGMIGIGTSQNYVPTPTATLTLCDLAASLASTESTPTFDMYPNPSSDKIYFKGCSNFNIEAFDHMGRKIMSAYSLEQMAAIDVSTWTPGIYLINLSSGHVRMSKQLVVAP